MSEKKRYRIRKAKEGEQVGVRNPMQQFMVKAQPGMQQPSPQEMAMMQQQASSQQSGPQSGQDQLAVLIQQMTQALQQGMDPQELTAKLLQGEVPPNIIAEAFVQLGVPKEKVDSMLNHSLRTA